MRALAAIAATLVAITSPTSAEWATKVVKPAPSCPNKISGDRLLVCSNYGIHVTRHLETGIGAFTIRNSGPEARDVLFTCKVLAESGTILQTLHQRAYVVVPANGEKFVAGLALGFVHPQADRVACTVTR